jgi:hypothetical protein
MPSKAVLYYLDETLSVIKSAALARALAAHTTVHFEHEMGNVAVNFMYNSMPWKERFGTMQIDQPSKRMLARYMVENFRRYTQDWLLALSAGRGQSYLDQMVRTKNIDTNNVQSVVQEATQITDEALSMMRDHIRAMAAVQCVSTIASAGFGAAAMVTFGAEVATLVVGTSMVRGLALDLAKSWHEGSSAMVVGVVKEGAKVGAEKLSHRAVHKSVETLCEKFVEEQSQFLEVGRQAARTIDHYSRIVNSALRNKVTAQSRLAQATSARAAASKGAVGAVVKAEVAKQAVPIAFAVVDSAIAIMEFRKVWEETEH